MRIAWGGFVVVVVVCVLLGCQGKLKKRAVAPATGVVTFQGKPLENARVTFSLIDSTGDFSYGVTDAQGEFKLSTYGVNDGAIVGKHKVTISKVDIPTETAKIDQKKAMSGGYVDSIPGYESMMGLGGKPAPPPKQELPKKYSDQATSQIVVEVTKDAASNKYEFKLD